MKTGLKEIASIFDGNKVLVLPHSNADPDALGSAIALAESLPDVFLGLSEGTNKPGKTMLKGLEMEPEPFILDDYDWVLCVDTSIPNMLGPYSILVDKKNVAVLDHHAESEDWPNALYHCDETKGSCAEQVYDLLKLMDVEIGEKAALALMLSLIHI